LVVYIELFRVQQFPAFGDSKGLVLKIMPEGLLLKFILPKDIKKSQIVVM
jgi:hypothetical protein